MATKNQDGTLSIEAWSLVEFLPEVIKAHDEGYVLDMDKNTGYPQQFGSMITVTMFPKLVQDLSLSTESEQTLAVDKAVVEDTTPVEVKGTLENYFKEDVTPLPIGTPVKNEEVTTAAPAQRGRPRGK